MRFSKSKWLAYTFFVGFIPILTRLLVWFATASGKVEPLVPTDFVAFGLVLHISIINEIEHRPNKDREWKTMQNGISIIFITLYSALYALTVVGEKIPDLIVPKSILMGSLLLSIVSTTLSFSVFHRISKLP